MAKSGLGKLLGKRKKGKGFFKSPYLDHVRQGMKKNMGMKGKKRKR